MVVNMFHLKKAKNSTKIPTESAESVITCRLKHETSLLNPVFEFTYVAGDPPFHLNYITVPAFKRNYFIRDWRNLDLQRWEIVCEVDPMGTYRQQIIGSRQFVERAEKSANSSIPDGLAIPTSSISANRVTFSTPWSGSSMVLAMGGNTTTYYAIDEGHLISLMNFMFGNRYLEELVPGWSEVFPQLKAEANPIQFIQSLRRFPFDVRPYANGGTQTIRVGYVNSPLSAPTFQPGLGARVTFLGETFSVPFHPQIDSYQYVAMEPFSEIGVWYPPFGDIALDAGLVQRMGGEVLTEIGVDLITGNGIIQCRCGGALLGSSEAKIGIDVAVSQTYRSEMSAGTVVGAAASIAGNLATMNIGGALEGIGSTLDKWAGSKVPKFRASGSNGGSAALDSTGYAYGRFQSVLAPSNHFCGRPLYAEVSLSSLSGGFVKCVNPEIKIESTEQEAAMIENYLKGGAYLE